MRAGVGGERQYERSSSRRAAQEHHEIPSMKERQQSAGGMLLMLLVYIRVKGKVSVEHVGSSEACAEKGCTRTERRCQR